MYQADTDPIPRRRLLQPLLDLLTRRRATPPPVPAPEPTGDDYGDDLLGIYQAEPAPAVGAYSSPSALYGDTGPDDWPEEDEEEQECALDGAPYYGRGVMGRYCSWGCADAAAEPDSADEAALPADGWQPPARLTLDGDDPWSSTPKFFDKPTG